MVLTGLNSCGIFKVIGVSREDFLAFDSISGTGQDGTRRDSAGYSVLSCPFSVG